jgi:hypothetical protein
MLWRSSTSSGRRAQRTSSLSQSAASQSCLSPKLLRLRQPHRERLRPETISSGSGVSIASFGKSTSNRLKSGERAFGQETATVGRIFLGEIVELSRRYKWSSCGSPQKSRWLLRHRTLNDFSSNPGGRASSICGQRYRLRLRSFVIARHFALHSAFLLRRL